MSKITALPEFTPDRTFELIYRGLDDTAAYYSYPYATVIFTNRDEDTGTEYKIDSRLGVHDVQEAKAVVASTLKVHMPTADRRVVGTDLICAVNSLLIDIEAMQVGEGTLLFDPEAMDVTELQDGTFTVEWPNLAISSAQVRRIMGELAKVEGK